MNHISTRRWSQWCLNAAGRWLDREANLLSRAARSPKETASHQWVILGARYARLWAEIWLALAGSTADNP